MIRKKKFKKVPDDIEPIIESLKKGELIGDEVPGIGLPKDEHVYKVSVANTSNSEGKSNGFRLIYYVVIDDKEIYLLTIYYKKDVPNVNSNEISNLIRELVPIKK